MTHVRPMAMNTHGDLKYGIDEQPGRVAEWDGLRIEHRQIGAGAQNCVRPECTELVYILGGLAKVRRRGDGQLQEGIARPGTSWLVPAGTHETLLELDGSAECLIIFLPDTLLERSALADYGIDPATVQLSYAAAIVDPTLMHIARTMYGMIGGEGEPSHRILADGMRAALAAHLIGHYTVDRQRLRPSKPSLDEKRLQRVLDLIEARLSEDLSLDQLASEACLSPFYFSRLFQDATGMSPLRFVTERRIETARELLARNRMPLAEIALETGFGSQASFTRTFRKVTGTTPRQYRVSRQE